MTDREDDEESTTNSDAAAVPIWLTATLDDARAADFESPILTSPTADCATLNATYNEALNALDAQGEHDPSPSTRVFHFLAALTSMHFRPDQPHEPYGPLMQWADGRRTAIPSDFRGHGDVLEELAARTSQPVLRARLCDLCWLLDRKRGKMALAAVQAYTEVVEKSERSEITYRFAAEPGALQYEASSYLRRALQLGRAVGWNKPPVLTARAAVVRLREGALTAKQHAAVRWFCSLDLDFTVSDPAVIGDGVTSMLATESEASNPLRDFDLWQVAARAYRQAKDEANMHRANSEAAECLVTHATAQDGSAMLHAHFLSNAIAALHGIPGKKDRRTELRHKLIDVQTGVPDEMEVFSETIDLKETAEEVQRIVGEADLLDMLFLVARLSRSPEQAELEAEARRMIAEHPLLSVFGGAHLDRHGKVLSRTGAAGLRDNADDSAVQDHIAQAERLRRQVFIHGRIEPALQMVRGRYHVSDETFVALLQHSAAVPHDLLATIARGFACFVQGDLVSATYILTPLLEAMLRYILRNRGHDVTIFDDATETQQDRTISSLFEQMRPELVAVLTADITADLERVFLTKPGPSLRHAVAHGLLHDGDPYGSDAMYGCWLIYRLCLLPLFAQTAAVRSSLGGTL